MKKDILQVTPGFLDIFGIEFLVGNKETFLYNPESFLMSDKIVNKQFSGESPIGKTTVFSNFKIETGDYDRDFFAVEYFPNFIKEKEYTATGVIRTYSKHSDFNFDYIIPHRKNDEESPLAMALFVKLRKGIDPKDLEKKWEADKSSSEALWFQRCNISLVSLKQFHNSVFSQQFCWSRNMTLQQIMIFACAGLITILCLIFNYLSLFFARLKQKRRELSLQIALGSSFKQLFIQMSIEFLLILFGAFALGCMAIEILMPYYLDFAGIEEYSYQIWIELIGYFGLIVVISEILLLWPLFYIRRHSLSEAIRGHEGGREKQVISQNSLLVVQLFVGILFLFCTSVFIIQVHHMKQDLGFNPERLCFVEPDPRFKNNVSFNLRTWAQEIQKFPEIESASYSEDGIIRYNYDTDMFIFNDYRDTVFCQWNIVSSSYFDVCDIKCLQGKLFKENEPDWNNDKIVINESMVKLLRLDNPIGKTIIAGWFNKVYQIIGVVSDVSVAGLQIRPIVYNYYPDSKEIVYRYKPGMRAKVEQKIREDAHNFMGMFEPQFVYMDELIETERKEDMNFMRLLYILTGVCIVGAMIGIYSMVSLACERRRKEIAIRKINGAGYGTLIKLFLKKYILLLVVACAVAFPTGYLLMKPWLEQFVRRINMDAWIFCSILAAVAVMISGIVIARIWRTLHANPANEIRKE